MSFIHRINTYIIQNKYLEKYCHVVIIPNKTFEFTNDVQVYYQLIVCEKKNELSLFSQLKNMFTFHL